MARSNLSIYEESIYVLTGNFTGESLKAGPPFIFSFRGCCPSWGFDENIQTDLPAPVQIKKLMPSLIRNPNPGRLAEYLDRISFFGVYFDKVARTVLLYEKV
ncbi:hypothetical protein ES703_103609 [subsurface metagenome]